MKAEQKKLLEEFINRAVLVQHVQAMGYRVSDVQIAREIEGIPALQVDGKFSRDRYAALLRAQGRTEADFERDFRGDIQVGQLRNGIGISAFVTPGELAASHCARGRDPRLRLLHHCRGAVRRRGRGDAGAGAGVLRRQQGEVRHGRDRVAAVPELKAADVAATVAVTDEALHQYYDQVAPERYVDAERRHARHILIESGTDDAAAKKKAEQVYAKAKAGEDFGKLASENSDDPGSKAQGGDLGWATRAATCSRSRMRCSRCRRARSAAR